MNGQPPDDESALRAEIWARQQVWRRQQEERHKASSSKAAPASSAKPTRTKDRLALCDGQEPRVAKPSTLLPGRLGLGRVKDVGGGEVRGRTRFAAAYKSGTVGQWLRVDQNGARPDLAFSVDIGDVPLAVALPLCFEGLSESTHPLCLLARRGATRLLEEHPRVVDELPGVLPRIVPALRSALACKERDVVQVAIAHSSLLAKVAQASLFDHLDKLLPPLARLAFGSPLAPKALAALRDIEAAVPGARSKIKAKLPSFD